MAGREVLVRVMCLMMVSRGRWSRLKRARDCLYAVFSVDTISSPNCACLPYFTAFVRADNYVWCLSCVVSRYNMHMTRRTMGWEADESGLAAGLAIFTCARAPFAFFPTDI
jgi:hypothetical protein